MKQSKDEFYMKQILDYIIDGEIVSTGKIAKEVGISEKSVRNKLNDLDDFLRENEFGTIQRKPRVGIWLEATQEQKTALYHSINMKGNDLVEKYNPRERMTETLKIFFHLWPWQKITTQKLADQLYLSVPTVLKVLKECENWLDKYNMKLVNERGKGYCLKGEESSYRIALKNLIMEKKSVEEIKKNLDYFFTNINVDTMEKCIIRAENAWKNHFTDESFYEILIYCCLAYKRKELGIPLWEPTIKKNWNSCRNITNMNSPLQSSRKWRMNSMFVLQKRMYYFYPFRFCVPNSLVFPKRM